MVDEIRDYFKVKILSFFDSMRPLFFQNRIMGYSAWRMNKFIVKTAKQCRKNTNLLDVGAGQCQYKKYFLHTNYISQDSCIGDKNWDWSQINIVSEIYNIPLKSGNIDNILCTEVLEHLKYPHLAFKEMSRLLKKGGKLHIIAPFIWGEHQKPNDFFRYTQYSYKFLAKDNSLKVVSLKNHGGKYICLIPVISEIAPSFFIDRNMIKTAYLIKAILYPLTFLIAMLLYLLDKLDLSKEYTSQYECVMKKI